MSSRNTILVTLSAIGIFSQILLAAGPDQVEGTLTVIIADYFTQHRSETSYSITDQTGRTYNLSFAEEPRGRLITGMIVKGHGRINGSSLEGTDLTVIDSAGTRGASPDSTAPSSSGVSLPAITPHSGVQSTLIYNLVSKVAGATTPNFTNNQLHDIMFASSGLSVNTYYLENSFNSVSFAGDIIGPYTVRDPTTCDQNNTGTQADQLATAAGIDISKYARRVYMMPSDMKDVCQFGGVSAQGGNVSWINTGFYSPSNSFIYVALAHELGHQLEMLHAKAIKADGSLEEYGDNSCVMGDEAYNVVDFNVVHRIQEGWIPLSNILQVSLSGTYTVNLAETQTNQVQALQIVIPGTAGNMYVSYRQPDGLDANLPSAFLGGASIHYWDGGETESQLATNYPWGGALSDGQTYASPDGIVYINQVSHTISSVTVHVSTTVGVSAASLLVGPLAAETIAVAFGTGLATGTAPATTTPLPFSLLGTSVTIVDSLGKARQAPLYYVSPTQVNYEIPAGTAPGLAEVSVTSGRRTIHIGSILIVVVSPGLFRLNSAGLAAGSILRVKSDGTRVNETLYHLDATGAVVPLPIDLSDPTDHVYLFLYGTGIRGAGKGGTTVTIGGVAVPVSYAGPQGSFVGLDQVNVLLPNSLAGQAAAPIVLVAGGKSANSVFISIKEKPTLAIDDFGVPPYHLGGLAGQSVGGSGFAGTWTQLLGQDLTVVSPGVVGRPIVDSGGAGDCATFASPINPPGQLFISYNITNQLGANLNSSRLDLNLEGSDVSGSRALLGGLGVNASFNFTVESGLGTPASAQTRIASTGSHYIVGVLDVTNQQIAIFVDPTAQSFYGPTGANNADAVAAWVPAAALAFQSYCLIENLADQVNFSNIAFSTTSASLTAGHNP